MPLKVLSARGSGSMGGIAQAIRWAADHGANVINMSLGGPFAVGAAGQRGEVRARQGRGGRRGGRATTARGRVSYPARYPGVIAVAATQYDESTTFYSNWGAGDRHRGAGRQHARQTPQGGVLQHTIVPGDIGRTDYLYFMGTSMASPHVAGVAALVVGAGVKKPEAVEQILLATARKPKAARARPRARASTTTTAPASSTRRRRSARRATAAAPKSWASAWRPACSAWRSPGGAGSPSASSARRAGGVRGRRLGPRSDLGRPGCPGTHAHAAAGVLSTGFTDLASGPLSATLVYSAAAPVLLTLLFYGVRKLRPALAGFGFGVAGALLFAAIAHTVDLRFVPDALEPRLALRAGRDRGPVRHRLPAQGVAQSGQAPASTTGAGSWQETVVLALKWSGSGPTGSSLIVKSRLARLALARARWLIAQQGAPAATVAQAGRTMSWAVAVCRERGARSPRSRGRCSPRCRSSSGCRPAGRAADSQIGEHRVDEAQGVAA